MEGTRLRQHNGQQVHEISATSPRPCVMRPMCSAERMYAGLPTGCVLGPVEPSSVEPSPVCTDVPHCPFLLDPPIA